MMANVSNGNEFKSISNRFATEVSREDLFFRCFLAAVAVAATAEANGGA
jgi:hypothetical protein